MQRLKELIYKVPWAYVTIAAVGFFGWDLYQFYNSPDSPLALKQGQLAQQEQTLTQQQGRLKEMKKFVDTLEAKKAEVRVLAQELEGLKASLSDVLDLPDFMRVTINEAKRSGLTITSLKPGKREPKEYYVEQGFELRAKGFFPQILAFLNRMSQQQRVVRVDQLQLGPSGKETASYTEIDGAFTVKTYQYLGTKADQVARESK